MADLPRKTITPRGDVWGWTLFVYAVGVTAVLLHWNVQAGGLVQQWYQEYTGPEGLLSGSAKWRTEEGKSFQLTSPLVGTSVYSTAPVAAGLLFRNALRPSRMATRLLSLAAAAGALYALYRLHTLGLLRAVTTF